MAQAQNRLAIEGSITELKPLRHTPAGLPVLNFRIAHASEQVEADMARKVEVVALGSTATLLSGAKPGDALRLDGFLAAKSAKSGQPVLHVERIEFVEGLNHGI